MDQLIKGIVEAIAVVIVTALAIAAARRPPQIDKSGAIVLRHGWYLKGGGLTLLAMGVFVVGGALIEGFERPGNLLLAGGGLLFFGVLGGWATLEAFRTRIILLEEGIISYLPLRGTQSVLWSEVEQVKYSAGGDWFTIVGPRKQKIRVSSFLTGIPSLAEFIRRKLPPECYGHAVFGFDRHSI